MLYYSKANTQTHFKWEVTVMLYTKKAVEKIIADLIASFINQGARVSMYDNNYSCSEHQVHVNLLLDDGRRITIYKTEDQWDGLHVYDCGTCEIGYMERMPYKSGKRTYYPEANSYTHVTHSLYHYKGIYTDNKDDYESMISKGDFRYANQPVDGAHFCTYHIKYNPDTILKVLKNHRGYKRLKANDIIRVDKVQEYCRKYYIIHIVGKEPIRVYFKN